MLVIFAKPFQLVIQHKPTSIERNVFLPFFFLILPPPTSNKTCDRNNCRERGDPPLGIYLRSLNFLLSLFLILSVYFSSFLFLCSFFFFFFPILPILFFFCLALGLLHFGFSTHCENNIEQVWVTQ